jgi:hypothetical protein
MYVCLVVLVTVDSVATAFVPLAATFHCHRPKGHAAKSMASTRIYSTSKESSTDISAENMFPDATILEFTLEEHKPLGCTVEESLAHPMEKHVFITKLKESGHAKAAGLQVGDVLVSIPGIFGDETLVSGMGVEQVKSLVSGRDEQEPLQLRVARGTDVMEAHENALVELCMTPGANDDQVEECLTTIMAGAYLDDDADTSKDDSEVIMGCDNEEECLLDSLYQMWEEDMPAPVKNSNDMEFDNESGQQETIAPWSSRSSPSGTYQRDPATGEMKRMS